MFAQINIQHGVHSIAKTTSALIRNPILNIYFETVSRLYLF